MCIYSLSAEGKVSKAKIGETLIRGDYKDHGVLFGDDGQLRCIRPNTELQVEKLSFDPQFFSNCHVHQPDGRDIPVDHILKWEGKPATITLVMWHSQRGYAGDAFKLPDGALVHLGWIAKGVRMVRTRKVRKDAGIKKPRNLAKVLGLDQIKADIPVTQHDKVKG